MIGNKWGGEKPGRLNKTLCLLELNKEFPYRLIYLDSVPGKNRETAGRAQEILWQDQFANIFQRQGYQLAKMETFSNILLESGWENSLWVEVQVAWPFLEGNFGTPIKILNDMTSTIQFYF